MSSHEHHHLRRQVRATQVPGGASVLLPEGTHVHVTQALGGSYTVEAPDLGGLFRIEARDADALGLAPPEEEEAPRKRAPLTGTQLEEAVWNQLRTCYDPEIPINIVDLGLIYDLTLAPIKGGTRVGVKMTLTAPGCGMGPAIASDARGKIESVPGVTEAEVEIIWDPPWSAFMMTPEARKTLGLA